MSIGRVAELSARLVASWRTHADRWLLAGAALALAVCLLDPGWHAERARFDHVIVLDITQSMNVQDEALDGKPVSRLDFAKHALRELLLRLPCGSRIGWAVFTEYRSFLLFEPIEVCANLSELRATLANIDGRMAWSGNSEIAKGVHSGIEVARQLPDNPSLVFITDGQEAPPLSPLHRPAFADKPGEVAGVLVGVGDLRPSPIPKSDPSGRPLGFWRADEVAQADLYGNGRGASVSGERMSEDGAAPAAPALGATPGSEHLSALREPYLRLLGRERGLAFVRLASTDDLVAALTAPALAKPTTVRVDLRIAFAGLALALLLARHARSLWPPMTRRAPRPMTGPAARPTPSRPAGAAVVRGLLLIALVGGLAAPQRARANDRPFQVARTAVLEDDEQVWSFESWAQRLGTTRGLSVEPEYSFSGGFSIQAELTRYVDRHDSETGHETEIEFKQIFNNVARDGWGWGLSASLAAERTRESGGTVPSIGIKLPVSIALGEGGGFLHLDAGIGKARDARRAWSGSAGIERELFRRTLFFAELAREGETTFMQVGARHWLKRDKLAIDFSLQQRQADGEHASGFIVGLGWYDL
ncbi:MAG TPA: vWA domain-containing protein [Burkholderiaceae bacterium]|jgi:mxaL protein